MAPARAKKAKLEAVYAATFSTNEDTVVFNVGGRIFEIRRTLLDAFPATILARSASKLWNTSTDVTPTVTQKKPIFIDRDSTRFSFILDYMRDNGVVELPVTVPRETFVKELEYYGFDIKRNKIGCITCTVPVVQTLKHIDKLHERFLSRKIEIHLDMELWVLAYACYCEILSSKSLDILISMSKVDSEYTFATVVVGCQ